MASKKRGLGRGLNALITEKPAAEGASEGQAAAGGGDPTPQSTDEIDITQIIANPFQPRQEFDDEALQELCDSIQALGVLQPLLVRKDGDIYQLIAGERRFRASQRAGLKTVPVRVLDIDDQQALEMALVENLQREDLDVIEEAEGYQRLSNEFDMTQEQIAQRVGKARATVANLMRLLGLPVVVRREVQSGNLTAGHAKALLGVKSASDQIALAQQISKEGLSVRAAEQLANEASSQGGKSSTPKKPRAQKPDMVNNELAAIKEQLQQKFGTGIEISASKTLTNGKKLPGAIQIEYYSNEDLNRILEMIGFDEGL